jgi:phosphoglycerol transferase MdoB-like AlkP superfamily enzyme
VEIFRRRAYSVLQRLILVFLLFQICRVVFLLLNFPHFRGLSFSCGIEVFTGGAIFDLSALLAMNFPFLLLALFPFPLFRFKAYRIFLSVLFVGTNALLLFLNLMDAGWYEYVGRRSTFDIFSFLGNRAGLSGFLGEAIIDYWYLALLFFAFLVLLILFEFRSRFPAETESGTRQVSVSIIMTLAFFALSLFVYRGGFRLKPIHIIDAGSWCNPRYSALVLNTPFTLMKSAGVSSLEEKSYLSDAGADSLAGVIKTPMPDGKFQRKNIVVIILESFSLEYTGAGSKESFTPFLDSLSGKSLFFSQAYAAGTRSIEALPAIFSSLPPWMDEPFITSPYAGNRIEALPQLLKKSGYSSAFFHGAEKGSMGFDAYCKSAGFDRYYGKEDYPRNEDFDGHWGIRDLPFLEFSVGEISKLDTPFVSGIFTLSSHHPYSLPSDFSKLPLPAGKLNGLPAGEISDLKKCILYTDYSLSRFFKLAKAQSWFSNTLFVICADHTGPTENNYYLNPGNRDRIPLLFYSPASDTGAYYSGFFQQTDILPTLLGLLKYPGKYLAFGHDVFSTTRPGPVFFRNGSYEIQTPEKIIHFNGSTFFEETWIRNPEEKFTGSGMSDADYKKYLLSCIQVFNRRMLRNELTLEGKQP